MLPNNITTTMAKFDYNAEIWYGMTQNQFDNIYDNIQNFDLNEKLFSYIAEQEMTFEDADQLLCVLASYPKGHSQRNIYNNGIFLFEA